MSKCLVTGGAGFIGSNLVEELIKRGDEVIIIDNLITGKKENINPQAKFYEVDLRNLD
ncbi:MAG: NAD-dependent epimerase/dehydratase family protein, partial [Patescibacteria group bacterium]